MSVPEEVVESFPLLMKWASLIHSSVGCNLDIPSLKSGRIFAEILHLSDDEYFTEDWLESIHSFDNSVNTRIIRHNMGKVEAMVKNYYAEKARRKLMGNELWSIADNIADDSDESTHQAIVAMACLVVSAPFLCSNANKEHMERLQNQTEEVQMSMVNAMQLVTTNAPEFEEGETVTLVSSHSRGSASALSATDDENPEQMQAMLKAKFDEVAKLTKEKERLEKELELSKKRSGSDSTTENMEKEIRILKSSKLKLEEHAIELESERDVCKQKLEELMCKNEDLEKKALSILSMEEELRRLRDEVEELRAKRMQMDDLSLAHEQLKNRNNEMKHLQQENQLLRNKVESYVRQIAELEEAKNNRKQLHSQLGAYKAKAEEKERDAEGLMRKVDMLAHELVVAQERISQLEVENRRLLDAKQEMETRLRLDGVLSQSGNESGVMEHSLHEDMKLSLGEANNSERIRELEAEKEQLLERVRTAESKIAQLESELKVETKKKADAKKMLDDLESYGQDDEEKKKDTVDLRLQIEKQNIEIDHLRKLYESAEKKATEADEAKLRTVGG
ncbi:hypothetical protein WR25_00978 isoform B [Diploscapter pachys]|uniref:HOOK N-terminal domain-containing protein n=1 Tax=Diploscapter pachys TaxID=2018661 RepID=A0A2A2JVU7_9BILA|nr:hypothetical protein WR25_00978 isoform B [Diploscapter pachys]